MAHLRFFTSGESHGRALTGILEGIPSGFPIASEDIDRELRRRQGGHGRGGRKKSEADQAENLSGARETAMRVALGAITKEILSEFDIRIGSYVIQIGSVSARQSKIEAMKSEKELWAAF